MSKLGFRVLRRGVDVALLQAIVNTWLPMVSLVQSCLV
jgi:hypothetical protein